MLNKILQRADVLSFLNEALTDFRFNNAASSLFDEENLFLKNQYGFLFAMDALIKFDIIVNDEKLIDEYIAQLRRIMKKFSDGDDLYIGLNKILSKIIASKLDIDDINLYDNKKKILNYIYDKYIVNGYIFHAFPSAYKKEILITGIDSSEAYYNLTDVKEIDYIFKNHGMGKVFTTIDDDNTYSIKITDSPLIAYFNALNMPRYLNTFTSVNDYMENNKFDNNAFYKKDKVACLNNINKLSNIAGLTKQEKEKVLNFFNKEWNLYKLDDVDPNIMFIKRKALNKDYLKEYDFILKNCYKEDISFSIGKLLESRYKNEKTNIKLSNDDYKFVRLVSYKKVFFKDEDGFEEVFNDFVEEKKEKEIIPNLVLVGNYGRSNIATLLVVLCAILGMILIILGIYKG